MPKPGNYDSIQRSSAREFFTVRSLSARIDLSPEEWARVFLSACSLRSNCGPAPDEIINDFYGIVAEEPCWLYTRDTLERATRLLSLTWRVNVDSGRGNEEIVLTECPTCFSESIVVTVGSMIGERGERVAPIATSVDAICECKFDVDLFTEITTEAINEYGRCSL